MESGGSDSQSLGSAPTAGPQARLGNEAVLLGWPRTQSLCLYTQLLSPPFQPQTSDFEGLAGAREGFTDHWVCPSCRLSVVSGDDAAWSMNQLSRTSRRSDTEGLGCWLWSDTINSHSWYPWSQEPPRLVCQGALHTQCALSPYFLFECVS